MNIIIIVKYDDDVYENRKWIWCHWMEMEVSQGLCVPSTLLIISLHHRCVPSETG